MSNHIDPKVQEIEQRLDFVNGLVLTGWFEKTLKDDVAYLLSEYKRLQTALMTMAESDDEWYVGITPMREYARTTISHLKGE